MLHGDNFFTSGMVERKDYLFIILCVLLICSCTQDNIVRTGKKEIPFSFDASKECTKTSYSESLSKSLWQKNDRLGITYTYYGKHVPEKLELFQSSNSEPSASAPFSGRLWDYEQGEYTIYGIYPYHGFHAGDDACYFLPEKQYPSRNDWDPDCDIMLAKSNPFSVNSISEISTVCNLRMS